MKNVTKALFCIVVMSILAATFDQATAVKPSVREVNISPSNPTVLSNVTFTAEITGDNIIAVHLIYKECDSQICKFIKNTTMIKTSEGTYGETITLAYDKATYMTYYFEINSAGTWTKTEYVNVTLSPASGDNDHNGTNGNGNNQKSPGFELIISLIAVGLLILALGKKRFR
jgi:hypothetical protein